MSVLWLQIKAEEFSKHLTVKQDNVLYLHKGSRKTSGFQSNDSLDHNEGTEIIAGIIRSS